jgi:nucleoid-associated protein YgaU
MDKLVNKKILTFDYVSRYAGVPYYFDKEKKREVFGIGSPMSKDTAYISHLVQGSDTLDSLALKYYNNPTYWWVIAAFNSILDPFINLATEYKVIKIPSISSIVFSDLAGR